MDKIEALEIVWKMLPIDATDEQKQAWWTVKRVVHGSHVPASQDCVHMANGTYSVECYSCKRYQVDLFEKRA